MTDQVTVTSLAAGPAGDKLKYVGLWVFGLVSEREEKRKNYDRRKEA